MNELARHLEETKPSRFRRFFEYVGGGLATAQTTEVGYVENNEAPDLSNPLLGKTKIGKFEISAPITSTDELAAYLMEDSRRELPNL